VISLTKKQNSMMNLLFAILGVVIVFSIMLYGLYVLYNSNYQTCCYAFWYYIFRSSKNVEGINANIVDIPDHEVIKQSHIAELEKEIEECEDKANRIYDQIEGLHEQIKTCRECKGCCSLIER